MIIRKFINILKTPLNYKIDFIKSIIFGQNHDFPPLPWMNYEAINYIDKIIKNHHAFLNTVQGRVLYTGWAKARKLYL